MIYAEVNNSNKTLRDGGDEMQAFDTMDDFRAAEEDGWKLTRVSRKHVESRIGRNFQVGSLDSDCCGYAVYPSS